MIDINLYRCRIGTYNRRPKSTKVKTGNSIPYFNYLNILNMKIKLYALLYLLIIMYILVAISCIILSSHLQDLPYWSNTRRFHYTFLFSVSSLDICVTHTKLLSAVLVTFLSLRIFDRDLVAVFKEIMIFRWQRCLPLSSSTFGKCNRLHRFLIGLCCWVFFMNFLMIGIVNPSLLNPGPNRLSVAYQNVQGFIPLADVGKVHPMLDNNKVLNLNSKLMDKKPSVVVLNETWLKGTIGDKEVFHDDQYKIFRLDRSSCTHPPDPQDSKKFRVNGGGVLIAIRTDLDIISTRISHKCPAEILGVTLTFKNGKKVIICTCYRVNNLGESNHRAIKEYIQKIRSRNGVSNIILLGDFNLPNVDWNDYSSRVANEQCFLDTFSSFGLEQLINEPTHEQGNILDLLLTDNTGFIADIKVNNDSDYLCDTVRDHFPITLKICARVKQKKIVKREIYNFKRADWDSINNHLSSLNWDRLLSSTDNIDICWNRFKTILFETTDRHIPKIKISNCKQPPWFDSETYAVCREKERFRAKYKSSKSTADYAKFSECRREFKRLVEKKMRDNVLDEDSNDITKKFWSYVKSKSNSNRIPEVVHLGDTYRSEPLEQVELFNNYFFDQFSSASNYDLAIDFNGPDRFDIDFNPTRIEILLLKTNPNKAVGPDGIHGKVLKNCAHCLSLPLSILFKLSYYTCSLPADWKITNVVPVHKKGSKSNVMNYRPISLTSLIVKTQERIIRDELMLRCSNDIDSRQHGFLPRKSCCTQLIGYCDSLSLSLNENIRTDVIYFDFAKAFDSVNHDIILKKLQTQFGINGFLLGYIRNYLIGRSQTVVLGNHTSSTRPVTSGVPQGSILGPTLFVLFLNDITQGLSDNTNISMYADDTKIWREILSEYDHNILQKDIDYLMDWAFRNCMNFHPAKCKALMVSKSKLPLLDIMPLVQFFYSMGDNVIDYCESEKDLGIYINGTLNFTEHSSFLYAKANQRFGLLKRTCHFVQNSNSKRILYLTLVRSLFEHCPVVWKPASSSAIEKLENLQKRAIKWILCDSTESMSDLSYTNNSHMYYIHCRQLQILPIKFRFDYHDLRIFHSIVYGFSCVKLPEYIKPFNGTRLRSSHLDHKCFVSSVVPCNLFSNNNFESSSTQGFNNSFFYRAHLLWNKLPLSVREIVCPGTFKQTLIKYLWKEDITAVYNDSLEINGHDVIENWNLNLTLS